MRNHCNDNSLNQCGMAMLMVLGIIAATTLLTVHLMAISEAVAKEATIAATMAQLQHQTESACDYGLWMHLTDRRLFSDRTVGNDLADREAISDFEPWMLDSREHEVDDFSYVYLNDAIKSFSISNIQTLKDNFDEDDTEGIEMADTFIDVYQDYIDSNDMTNIYGKEADIYINEGFPTLPRNGAMQFREELYWLENWREVIPGEITIIPPKGITIENGSGRSGSRNNTGRSSGSSSTKPNFFTASDADIRNTLLQKALQITDLQIEQVIAARDAWLENSIPISESLDADLLLMVKNYFSFTESGYAEITAVAYGYNGAVRAVRTVTREVNVSSRTMFSDSAKETLSIWEIRHF